MDFATMAKTARRASSPFRHDRLKAARVRRDLTQEDVETRLGLGENQMSRYENGKSRPLPDVLVALADLLQVSTDYLLGRTDEPLPHVTEADLSDDEKRVLQAYRENDLSEYMRLGAERAPKQPRE